MKLRNSLRSLAMVAALALPMAGTVHAANAAQKAAVKATLAAKKANGTLDSFLTSVASDLNSRSVSVGDKNESIRALAIIAADAGATAAEITAAFSAVPGLSAAVITQATSDLDQNPGKVNLATKLIADTYADAGAGFFDQSASQF